MTLPPPPTRQSDRSTRVMIVDDSRAARAFLEQIIDEDPRLEVISSVENAEQALRSLRRMNPDVISMDINLPGMNGFEATRRVMEESPTPVVVVSGRLHDSGLCATRNALKVGALAVVEKPVGRGHKDFSAQATQLCTQLASMSQVPVVRQRFNHRRTKVVRPPLQRRVTPRHTGHLEYAFVGIVASTGGPGALKQILGSLPPDFPLPITLVQHIIPASHPDFVAWLGRNCALHVTTAMNRQFVAPGTVYVAPAGADLQVKGTHLRVRPGAIASPQTPSGDVLLDSLADHWGRQAIGMVLTGMGDDGARGLLRIREAGGLTIAEHQSTAVVYGMPAVAARLGAVRRQLPLPQIGAYLMQSATRVREAGT